MTTALLVVDAQQIYTQPESAMYCKQAGKTLENINKLVERFEKVGKPILFIRHIHKVDGSDLGRMFDFAGPAETLISKLALARLNSPPSFRSPKVRFKLSRHGTQRSPEPTYTKL